jgi:hypothetical protein
VWRGRDYSHNELRDDQSPFFKETMSELLQSDLTEDRAATALLGTEPKAGRSKVGLLLVLL